MRCAACYKNVNVNNKLTTLCCAICNNIFHARCTLFLNSESNDIDFRKCISFSCHICLQENLPFNHYNDDPDFLNAVLDIILLSIDYNHLMNLVFNPFTFDNNRVLLYYPDTNFFNDILCNNTL